MANDFNEKDFEASDKYNFELGWKYNTVNKWDHCVYEIHLPEMYVGGLNFIPSGTKEVNAYMNYFETETDTTTKVKT